MNKYQESLKRIEEVNPSYISYDDIKILQELVNRATPKKLMFTENNITKLPVAQCPYCNVVNHDFENLFYKFCPECGQAMDWSNEE